MQKASGRYSFYQFSNLGISQKKHIKTVSTIIRIVGTVFANEEI